MVLVFKFDNGAIVINLPKPGIYGMGDKSATGKTYLHSLINLYGTDIVASGVEWYAFFGATDYLNFAVTYRQIPSGSLVILDRMDYFYSSEWEQLLDARQTDLYTLIDIKFISYGMLIDRRVSMKITKEGVVITA